jgi:hypothetical protein
METITLKINKRSKAGKAFNTLLQVFLNQPGIEIIEEKSPYNSGFVKKIKQAEKQGIYTEINPKDVWGSLGLK